LTGAYGSSFVFKDYLTLRHPRVKPEDDGVLGYSGADDGPAVREIGQACFRTRAAPSPQTRNGAVCTAPFETLSGYQL